MTDFAPAKNEALTSDELDRVAGGIIIIIVSGMQHRFTPVLQRVALNPPPLLPKNYNYFAR